MSSGDLTLRKTGNLSRLLQNVGYFAAGGLVTRLVAIGLVPFYARSLGPSGYGEIELITSAIGLLFPLISLSLYEGVLRFVMSKDFANREVMSTALALVGIGLLFGSVAFYLLAGLFPALEAYALYIILLLILQTFRSILSQYCRAVGDVRSFVAGGILEALITAAVGVFAIYIIDLGVLGYIAGLAAGITVSIFFFIWRGRVWEVFSFTVVSWSIVRSLVAFCFPLMINGALWWIVNSVNRLFIAEFSGVAEVGVFGVAHKVSGLLTAVIIVFNQAWQMSANEEYQDKSFRGYVTAVFNGFHLLSLVACVSFAAIAVPLIVPLFGSDFSGAGRILPFLLLSAVLSGSTTFIGALLMAKMNTRSILWSSLVAGVVVLIANYLLVPSFGAIGASVAAIIGFSCLLVFRFYSVRETIPATSFIKVFLGVCFVLLACIPSIIGAGPLANALAQLAGLVGILIIYLSDIGATLVLIRRRLVKS